MDISAIVSVISTVGFPIVMCIIMFKYIATLTENHKEEIKLLKDSMSSNMDKLDQSIDNNSKLLVDLKTLIQVLTNGKEK